MPFGIAMCNIILSLIRQTTLFSLPTTIELSIATKGRSTCSDARKKQIYGQSPRRFTPPLPPEREDSAGINAKNTDGIAAEVPHFIECKLSRYDGSLFDAEVNLNQLELGEKTVFQAIVREITDLKRAER